VSNALEACIDVRPASWSKEAPTGPACSGERLDNGPGAIQASGSGFQAIFHHQGPRTGLGLALVQKIVVTHNGRVSAANAEVEGLPDGHFALQSGLISAFRQKC
jgi:hypothetical protein